MTDDREKEEYRKYKLYSPKERKEEGYTIDPVLNDLRRQIRREIFLSFALLVVIGAAIWYFFIK